VKDVHEYRCSCKRTVTSRQTWGITFEGGGHVRVCPLCYWHLRGCDICGHRCKVALQHDIADIVTEARTRVAVLLPSGTSRHQIARIPGVALSAEASGITPDLTRIGAFATATLWKFYCDEMKRDAIALGGDLLAVGSVENMIWLAGRAKVPQGTARTPITRRPVRGLYW
jgi:hypothetical protein